MRKWLARLAFSFVIVAAACAWEAHQGNRPAGQRWAFAVASAVALACGIAGVNERHRADDRMGPQD